MNNDNSVTQNEEKLIIKARQKEKESFGLLYDKYMPAIYRFIVLRISHKQEAEDLTHQVFLNAWIKIEEYDFRGFPFSSWLYRIAHNLVIDYYRTNRQNFLDIDSVDESFFADHPQWEVGLDDETRMKQIKNAIAKLEPDQQSVLILKFVNDLSNKEIAESLEKKEGAIRVIQHRALKNLKKYVEQE